MPVACAVEAVRLQASIATGITVWIAQASAIRQSPESRRSMPGRLAASSGDPTPESSAVAMIAAIAPQPASIAG